MTPHLGVTNAEQQSGELLTAAQKYKQMGRWPLPIPLKEKAPRRKNWTELRLSDDEIEREFGSEQKNIGIILGEPSGWVVDVDLDCQTAVELAPGLLPYSHEVFGRRSNPGSHYVYVSQGMSNHKFQDTDNSMLLEIRSTAHQTVFPPSIHPSGEAITWARQGTPTEVPAEKLLRAAGVLATATLLVRHWPDDGRHKLVLAISAVFARAGVKAEDISDLIEMICSLAGDNKTRDRVRTSKYAPDRVDSGKPAYGLPTIAELLGKPVADKIRSWLRGCFERG